MTYKEHMDQEYNRGLEEGRERGIEECIKRICFNIENLKITALMKIKFQKRYKPDKFTFDRLRKEYGIYAVRGPRGMPHSLSLALR